MRTDHLPFQLMEVDKKLYLGFFYHETLSDRLVDFLEDVCGIKALYAEGDYGSGTVVHTKSGPIRSGSTIGYPVEEGLAKISVNPIRITNELPDLSGRGVRIRWNIIESYPALTVKTSGDDIYIKVEIAQ